MDRSIAIRKYKRKFIISMILAIPVVVIQMILMFIPATAAGFETTRMVGRFSADQLIAFVLTFPIQFILGFQFYVASWKALRHCSANMDVLIALGTTSAFLYSVASIIVGAVNPSVDCTYMLILPTASPVSIALSLFYLVRMTSRLHDILILAVCLFLIDVSYYL
jgi:cation transport ATPase